LGLAVQEVAAVAAPLFEHYHQARLALERATAPSWRYAVEDIRQQLAHLMPPGFLTSTPWRWLQQYPRYLQAIRIRLEKLSGDGLARDRRHAAEIAPCWEAYLDLHRRQTEQGRVEPQLSEHRWLLEEYRVSLFAQQLGTAVPVSRKRLDAAWKQVDGHR
jgi:ATP-dependent helicase HrpA